MELDRSGVVPLYRQIAKHFLDAIESNDIAPGRQLGNEIELARKFGVSRPTMRQAIQTLVSSGLLVRKPGIGTTVLPGVITRPVRLTSLADDLKKDGQQPVTTVLLNRVIPAPAHVSEQLHMAPAQPTVHLRRLRALHGQPLVIMENYLPADLLDLHTTDFSNTGLYQALRAVGVHPKVARQRISARAGTIEECQVLDEPPNSAVLTMDRLTHSDTGRPIEWAQHIYRPDRYAFTLTLTAP